MLKNKTKKLIVIFSSIALAIFILMAIILYTVFTQVKSAIVESEMLEDVVFEVELEDVLELEDVIGETLEEEIDAVVEPDSVKEVADESGSVNLKTFTNDEFRFTFDYDQNEFQFNEIYDTRTNPPYMVYVRGKHNAYQIRVFTIVDPEILAMSFDEYAEFMSANDGLHSWEGYRGADKVFTFSAFDSYEDVLGTYHVDVPSDIWMIEHNGKRFRVQMPFLGNETTDTLRFF